MLEKAKSFARKKLKPVIRFGKKHPIAGKFVGIVFTLLGLVGMIPGVPGPGIILFCTGTTLLGFTGFATYFLGKLDDGEDDENDKAA